MQNDGCGLTGGRLFCIHHFAFCRLHSAVGSRSGRSAAGYDGVKMKVWSRDPITVTPLLGFVLIPFARNSVASPSPRILALEAAQPALRRRLDQLGPRSG